MVGILLSYWGGLFSRAFAVSFRECNYLFISHQYRGRNIHTQVQSKNRSFTGGLIKSWQLNHDQIFHQKMLYPRLPGYITTCSHPTTPIHIAGGFLTFRQLFETSIFMKKTPQKLWLNNLFDHLWNLRTPKSAKKTRWRSWHLAIHHVLPNVHRIMNHLEMGEVSSLKLDVGGKESHIVLQGTFSGEPPKINSEFTPEKWWLEDYDFHFKFGLFSLC